MLNRNISVTPSRPHCDKGVGQTFRCLRLLGFGFRFAFRLIPSKIWSRRCHGQGGPESNSDSDSYHSCLRALLSHRSRANESKSSDWHCAVPCATRALLVDVFMVSFCRVRAAACLVYSDLISRKGYVGYSSCNACCTTLFAVVGSLADLSSSAQGPAAAGLVSPTVS